MRFMNENFCTDSATVITASSEDVNFPASNLKNPLRSKRWRSTGDTSESVVFDLITTESIDSVVLMWPKEDGIRLSGSAVITVQANATNVWTSPAVSQTLTIDNTYVMSSYFWSSAQNYRYWRVVIADPDNANGFVELGVCWLGKSISIENAQNGFQYILNDLSQTTTTAFGHTYVDQYPLQAQLNFTYQYLAYTDVQTLENAYRQNRSISPVMVVVDADGVVFNPNHILVYGLMMAPATASTFSLTHVVYNILNSDGITVTELS